MPRLTSGVDHVAYVTFDPEATVKFYTEVLRAPLSHCITARGWGSSTYPDFVHFFFDIGAHASIAFFYYFGLDEEPLHVADSRVPRVARHLSLHCDDLAELTAWEEHLASAGCRVSRTEHETITSIYFKDPNGIQLELTAPNRRLTEADHDDARRSIDALIEAVRAGDPTLERVWQLKGDRLAADRDADGPADLARNARVFRSTSASIS
jgi:catechol 2,3-dioxygenase-like lactoylglutathione lyase family enzyme